MHSFNPEVIGKLEAEGCEIKLEGDQIRVSRKEGFSPSAEKVNQLLSEIRPHKKEVIAYLGNRNTGDSYDHLLRSVIDTLNRAGVTMDSIPEAKRHEAFLLEKKLTDAANENRMTDFRQHLQGWRQCFH